MSRSAVALVVWAALGCDLAWAEIRAGLAQTDLTPPLGGLTTGYSDAQPTDGVHDPVTGRVLVLESGDTTVAFVVCDLCIFSSPWLHEQAKTIGIDHLLLMNTHSHSGPRLEEFDGQPADPWRKTVEQRLFEALQQAQQQLFPAYFRAAEGHIQLGYNRLVRQGDHAVTHFDNPDRIPYGPVDPTVGVLRITDEQGKVRAVLVHYACHPVVLGPENRKISADYPGVMRHVVEQQVGDSAMCIFVQGGGGDINPLFLARGKHRDQDFEVVEAMGRQLATEVLRVLQGIEKTAGDSETLAVSSSVIKVADRWSPEKELTLGVASLLINGEIGIVTMPGEPFHRFQVEFREQAALPHAYLFGYCSNDAYDWPAYLPDLASAARGGYGASDTTLAEVGAGERLLNRGLAQLFKIQGRLKTAPQRHIFD